MAKVGLFTRTSLKDAAKKTKPKAGVSKSTLKSLGLKGVEDMNPKATNPNLKPQGEGDVYLLLSAPTLSEDEKGKYCCAGSNKELKKLVGRCRVGAVCQTVPPKGRNPLAEELICFKEEVEKDIYKAKPKVVITAGKIPTDWLIFGEPTKSDISAARGKKILCSIKDHRFWVCPIQNPSIVFKRKDESRFSNDEWYTAMRADITKAKATVKAPVPKYTSRAERSYVENNDASGYFEYCKNIPCTDQGLKFFARKLKELSKELFVACDYETTVPSRPYDEGSTPLTWAVGTDKEVISIGLEHDGATWTSKQLKKIYKLIGEFYTSGVACIFHNSEFDLEWVMHLHGHDSMFRGRYEDTLAQAYTIDVRKGAHSLNFLCQQYFGVNMKKICSIDRTKLNSYSLKKVLDYNAVDVIYTYMLYKRQDKVLEKQDRHEPYDLLMERIPVMMVAQHRGIPVSQKAVNKIKDEYESRQEKALKDFTSLPESKRYYKRYGRQLNPLSEAQVKQAMLNEEYACKRTKSMDEKFMKQLNNDFGDAILQCRKNNKMIGTYIMPLFPDHKKTVLYPDGKIHTQLTSIKTSTGRLASSNPNMQNFPKRDPERKKIRKCVYAPKGWVLISADYAQIEARMIAMASGDKILIDSLWTGYDIHMAWSKTLVQTYPKWAKKKYGLVDGEVPMKKVRGDIKNTWVFPAFYGAGCPSISRNLGIDRDRLQPVFNDFWDEFRGVKKWQQTLVEGYRKDGYVTSLTGRRRPAPLSINELLNSPVQGAASDIVVDAMVRLAHRGYNTDKPWLCPILNIHDDLTFLVPEEHEEEAINIIVCEMVDTTFPWINVPIGVEVERGRNWYNMETVEAYESHNLPEHIMDYRL